MTIQQWIEALFEEHPSPLHFRLPLDCGYVESCISIRPEWVDERPAFVWRESSKQWERVYFCDVRQSVALFARVPPQKVEVAAPFTHAVLFEEVGEEMALLTLLSLLSTFHTVGAASRGWIFFWPETSFSSS